MQRPDPCPPSKIESRKVAKPFQSVSVDVSQNEPREHEKERDSTVPKRAIEERDSKLAQHMVNEHPQRGDKPNACQSVNMILRWGGHTEISDPTSNCRRHMLIYSGCACDLDWVPISACNGSS